MKNNGLAFAATVYVFRPIYVFFSTGSYVMMRLISELKLKFKQLDIPASILYARDIVRKTPKIRENKAACITCQHSNSVVLPPTVYE